MIINDCVLDLKRYWSPYGSVAPAATPWPDISRFHTDGVVTTATWIQQPSGLWAMNFVAATPDYVVVTCPQCCFTSEDYSIVARVKFDDISGFRKIFIRGLIATDGFGFIVAAGQVMGSTFQAAASQYSRTPVNFLVADTYYTLGLSRSGNSIRVFIDGADETTIVGVHVDPLANARTAKIGVYDDLTTYPLDGQISALKVFSYALNADQQMQKHINLSNNWE